MYTAKTASAAVRILVAFLVGLMAGLPVHGFGPSVAFAQEVSPEEPTPVEMPTEGAPADPAPIAEVSAEPAPVRERRVAVFTFSGKRGMDPMAVAVGTLARQAVENLDGIVLASSTGVVDGGKLAQAGSLFGSIEAGLNEDVEMHPEALSLALAESQEAIALLKQTAGAADVRTWALAWKNLAVAQALSLQPGPASVAMRASLLLRPDQQIVEYGYSIGVENLFLRVQGDMATESNGSLRVNSRPSGAEVRVDGKSQGVISSDGPIEVSGLVPGLHRVEVSLDGQMMSEAFVEVREGQVSDHAVFLTPAPFAREMASSLKGIQRKFHPRKATMFMQQLRTALGADELLVVRVKPGRRNSVALDVLHQGFGDAVQQVSQEIPRDATFFEQVRSLLANRLGSVSEPEVGEGPLSMPNRGVEAAVMGADGLVIDPDSPLFKDIEGGSGDALTDQWWFWTAIGVGVAGAVAAIVVPLVLSAEEADVGPTGAIQFNFSDLQE
jgi:hypothetical protein